MKRNYVIAAVVLALLALGVVTGFGDRVEQARAANAAAVEADFNGRQMPEDMVGPHNWWAKQTFTGAFAFGAQAKTSSFTVGANESFYIIDSSGGAVTATISAPSTYATGQCWGAVLKTAGNAVTFSAAPYSINGAVSTNAMDAAGDSYIFCNNGAGFDFLARYIH